MALTVGIYTLGCKVNQYESSAMEKLFKESGYEIVPFNEKADIFIINTCTVTSVGDKKSRQIIRRAKHNNPSAVVAVVGCMAQVSPEEVKKIEEVDIILGTNNKNKIVEMVEKTIKQNEKIIEVNDVFKEREFEDMPLDSFSGRERAYVKIQDGCDRFCSYCIIPYARGAVKSRSEESIISEVKRLALNGFTEITLAGIHVASYGRDTGSSLIEIIKKVHEIDGVLRIRLSSIDPLAFTDSFIEEIAKLKKVCPHFHISLQSGSDEILKKMNRKYTSSQYSEVLQKIRSKIPDVAITTDVITGFPYETDEEFKKSYEFVKNNKLSDLHVFPYSEREGTPAATFPDSIKKEVREMRAREMIELGKNLRHDFVSGFLGTITYVLFEQKSKNGLFEGFTPNYIRVSADLDESIIGTILPVRIIKTDGIMLMGEILKK